eukprot:151938_1
MLNWANKLLDHVDDTASTHGLKGLHELATRPAAFVERAGSQSDTISQSENEEKIVSNGSPNRLKTASPPRSNSPFSVKSAGSVHTVESDDSNGVDVTVVSNGSNDQITGKVTNLFGNKDADFEKHNNLLKREVSDLNAQVGSLRKVWNETRHKLDGAKKLLLTREAEFRENLLQKDDEIAHQKESRMEDYEAQIEALKVQIDQNAKEFELSLNAKSSVINDLHSEKSEIGDRAETHESEVLDLKQMISVLKDQRNDLIRQEQIVAEAHSNQIHQLKEQFFARQQELDHEKKRHSSTREAYVSRETTLEADNIEYTNALAKAERELQEKANQYNRLLGEKRWLEADHEAIKGELAASKNAFDIEQNQTAQLNADLRQRINKENDIMMEHRKAIAVIEKELSTKNQRIDELEKELQNASSTRPSAIQASLEQRLRSMTDHLLRSKADAESSQADLKEARVQLDAERKRADDMAKEARDLRSELDGEEPEVEFSSIRVDNASTHDGLASSPQNFMRMRKPAGAKSGRLQMSDSHPAFRRAVTWMDSTGTKWGRLLRRNHWVRLGSIAYVIVLHLWVMYVLYHFHNHELPTLLDADTMESKLELERLE